MMKQRNLVGVSYIATCTDEVLRDQALNLLEKALLQSDGNYSFDMLVRIQILIIYFKSSQEQIC